MLLDAFLGGGFALALAKKIKLLSRTHAQCFVSSIICMLPGRTCAWPQGPHGYLLPPTADSRFCKCKIVAYRLKL